MSREHFNVGDYVQINNGLIGRIIDYNYDSYFWDYRYKVSCSPVSYLGRHIRRLSIGEVMRYKRKHIKFNFNL